MPWRASKYMVTIRFSKKPTSVFQQGSFADFDTYEDARTFQIERTAAKLDKARKAFAAAERAHKRANSLPTASATE